MQVITSYSWSMSWGPCRCSPAMLPSLPVLCSSALYPCILHSGSCKSTHGRCTGQPRLAPVQEWGTLYVTWASLTVMPVMPAIQRRRLAWTPIRECLLGMPHVLPATAVSGSSASFVAGGLMLRNVHIERYAVFFRRTVDFSRRRCWCRWHSSMLQTFRLDWPLWFFRKHGRSCVIGRTAKTKWCKKIQRSVLSIRNLFATSVLSAYYLLPIRTYFNTVYVLSPYCLRTLYADSAEISTLIWSAERVRTPWTEYGRRRRQYGQSTEPVRIDFIRSIHSI